MAKRRSIHVPELGLHQQPIPDAARVGNMIFSSAISGKDRETKSLPEAPEAQIRNAFANMNTIIEAAGCTTGDIAKLTVFLADRDMRTMVNEEWLKMFPDEHDRPVRHTISGPLPGGYIIQMEFVAVL